METACYKILHGDTFSNVYEPSEDTFCLIDALEKDMKLLTSIQPTICLEIGCGSGVVITSLAKYLGNKTFYLCSDINKHAAKATKLTSEANNIEMDVVITDLVQAYQSRLKNSIDLLLFNPPYVVTPTEEINGDNLQIATAGGTRGREVMDRLFPIIPQLLSPKEDIARVMSTYGLHMTVVLSRRCGIEHLFVLRFSYFNHPQLK